MRRLRLPPFTASALVALAPLAFAACDAQPAAAPAAPATAQTARAEAAGIPGGSLSAHEDVEGGHPVSRHVGRSDADLRARLAREGVRTASTFTDLATADAAVGEVLRREAADVAGWLRSSPAGLRPFRATLDRPVGRVLRSGRRGTVEARTVVVVLAPTRHFPEGFRVHTAYVETP